MKWWFSDYDGTINVNHDDEIEQGDLDFINEWVEGGNKLVIATGRMNHEILSILEKYKLNYDYLIMNNGACIYDNKNNLIENVIIPFEKREEIISILNEYKDRFSLSYCIENTRKDLTYVPLKEVDENPFFDKTRPRTNNFELGSKEIISSPDLNLIYFFLQEKDVQEICDRFNKIDGIRAVCTVANVVEVMSDKVSKAFGINEVIKMENINLNDIYTSGDGNNDVEMLELTKNSFAMEKGSDAVKKSASHVISRVREIKKYL